MSKLSVAEVEALLLEHTEENDYYDGWDGWEEISWCGSGVEWSEPEEVVGLGAVEMRADTYTGSEGGGEDCEMVFRVTFLDGSVRHFKLHGRYFSYDGTNWNGPFVEVQPKQKTITVFEE